VWDSSSDVHSDTDTWGCETKTWLQLGSHIPLYYVHTDNSLPDTWRGNFESCTCTPVLRYGRGWNSWTSGVQLVPL
jgi:hypothetical protein